MNAKQAKTLRAFVKFVTHAQTHEGARLPTAKYRVDNSTVRMKQYYDPLTQIELDTARAAVLGANPDILSREALEQEARKIVPPTFQYPSATIFADRRSGRAYYKHLKDIGMTRQDVYDIMENVNHAAC